MERIPKPGTWMEYFKKSCGFLLFFIAVKLTLAALEAWAADPAPPEVVVIPAR